MFVVVWWVIAGRFEFCSCFGVYGIPLFPLLGVTADVCVTVWNSSWLLGVFVVWVDVWVYCGLGGSCLWVLVNWLCVFGDLCCLCVRLACLSVLRGVFVWRCLFVCCV